MAKTNFQSVDEYISTFPKEVQDVLEEIRRTVHEAVPEAQEKISYQAPTFTLDGKYLIYLSAWKNHIGMYGQSSEATEAFREQLTPYLGEKGALRFPLNKPMPLSLISDLVKFSAKERLDKAKTK
ncbi:MAG: DUF1801 domain-containing protein [Dehalococcoidia bacterium]|nr:DUF1801 domain-containing protein [Dehalococcoidia bacterium]